MTAIATTTSRGDDQLVHAALLYRDPQQLRLAVGAFLDDAHEAGEPVLAVLPSHSLQALGEVLEQPGVQFEDMAQAGRNPARLIPRLRDWLDGQPGRARVVSEPLWPGRSDAEAAECLRHEALLNVALAGAPVSILCPYDAEHLAGELIAGAERTHPQLIDDAGPRPSVVYGDQVLVAEGAQWPQQPTPPDATELPFAGDLAALRRAAAADPRLAVLGDERRADLVFAINEVVTNAVRHGDGDVRALVWSDGDEIVTEVTAPTPVADPLAGLSRPGPDATDGRGLWLVNQLCDLVELRNIPHGCSVRMHLAA
jgi:anti-sigma regulatory factor (Ser/Thr protein kinase)